MTPARSMITPLPMRSVPRMRAEGWARGTVARICTIEGNSSLTKSTATSTTGLPAGLGAKMTSEELGHAPTGVGERGRVVGDGGATALVRLVAVGHVGQERARLAFHIEIMKGSRVEDDRCVGAVRLHGRHHLGAHGGQRPIVGVADEDEQGPDRPLLHER